jgi:AcrR family transcriptional regulator
MKEKVSVENAIVDKALEMFNEKGVEYVGMRELALALDMRVGNLTYYFPTKDDLVYRLSMQLGEANNKTIVASDSLTMETFFVMLQQVFRNHYRYRCLMLSFVHIMKQNPLIAKRYSKTQSQRNETWLKNVESLQAGKYIKADKQEVNFLVSIISLIARFWLSEAAIAFKKESEEEQAMHYLKMIARIYLPYCTAKGKAFLDEFIKR